MLNLKELEKTELFSFFNLSVTEKIPDVNGLTRVMLKTGGFQEHVNIELKIDDKQTIHEATLLLARSFIGNELNLNPFAKDICKSFIAQLCSMESGDDFNDLVEGLWTITGKNDNVIYKEPPKPYEQFKSTTKKAIQVYMGLEPSFKVMGSYLTLSMSPTSIEGNDWLRVFVEFNSGAIKEN